VVCVWWLLYYSSSTFYTSNKTFFLPKILMFLKVKWIHSLIFFCVATANLMGFEESRKHLLSLNYHELQCLCKRYNLPANKTHTQLATSLASLLEVNIYVVMELPLHSLQSMTQTELGSSFPTPSLGCMCSIFFLSGRIRQYVISEFES
jgi:hypothetical protein